MLKIAIDGACRRNGKPDCVASGAIFIQYIEDSSVVETDLRADHEYCSTNQRGELLALTLALRAILNSKQEAQIITDSEYLFNAMTKKWCDRWSRNGFKTASGEEVKNADMWATIAALSSECDKLDIEVNYYHIKGHCIPFGKVTANNLLYEEPTGSLLYAAAAEKYDNVAPTKQDVLKNAQNLSIKNNGFELSEELLKDFVVSNVVVDAIATAEVDAADRKI